MSVCCECCVLSGRGLCDALRGILPTVMRHCVWSRNLKNEEALVRVQQQSYKENTSLYIKQTFIWRLCGPLECLLLIIWRLCGPLECLLLIVGSTAFLAFHTALLFKKLCDPTKEITNLYVRLITILNLELWGNSLMLLEAVGSECSRVETFQ
jgi:hypothetical protein